MKKMLLVLCVVMMGSLFASATHYTVTLTNFCDSWGLTVDHGNTPAGLLAPKKFVWGVHDPAAVCTGTFDTIGMKHGVAFNVPPNDIFGTGIANLDIFDVEGNPAPIEFLIRVTSGCGAAAYVGGQSFGGHFFIAEDTCTVGPAPTRTGLKPMVARQ